MKKSGIIAVVVVLAVAGSMFIPPVQAFAVNAMGVFRVSDPKVINISTQDLTELAQNVQALMGGQAAGQDQSETASQAPDKQDASDMLAQYEKTLNSASDFKAFSFKLPTYFKDQTPAITEIDVPAQSLTIDTASINEALAALQSTVTLPSNLDGRKATVTPSPMVVAEYSDAVCFAAQKPSVDLPGNMETAVTQIVTTLPLLPEDIRAQLGDINLFDKNIYLPNVEGVTKTADLGGSTGYIYAVNDITALAGNLLSAFQAGQAAPDGTSSGASLAQELQKYAGCEVIVWVKNNTLYGVAGRYTDDQLAAIAKTMQ
ncbi:MAG: hypothetical protein FWF44_11980 [Defluviitaleaceae bacterium]|nr:hypothetical protein [Defluviitaleaceae bacterium]